MTIYTYSDNVPAITEFKGAYAFLSNFHPCEIVMSDGITYRSVEHAYQAAKTHDVTERQRIAKLPTAGAAKRAGKELVIRPDWDTVKLSVMRFCVAYKFAMHTHLQALLLATAPAQLIEGNAWGDTFWGKCNGVGENYLGIILMTLREELSEKVSR